VFGDFFADDGPVHFPAAGDVDLAAALEKIGATQQASAQKGIDASYSDYMMGQQWPIEMIKMLTSTLSGTPYEKSQTQTLSEPNNSGFGILGSLAGGASKEIGSGIGKAITSAAPAIGTALLGMI
jgi:hypothetical protein